MFRKLKTANIIETVNVLDLFLASNIFNKDFIHKHR